MKVGVVDIGTNSMRLLIMDGGQERGRWVEVTGLGRGVDQNGYLAADAVDRTVSVLSRFGSVMSAEDVTVRAAMATSATRDAANRESFLDRAESALGVRPEVITGEREGALAYAGATAELSADNWIVSDIGGGSTEFVSSDGVTSIDIGSVRLSDRVLGSRPSPPEEMATAVAHVSELFSGVEAEGDVIGVAGTWTSLAGIDLALDRYERTLVHHHRLSRGSLESIIADLSGMSLRETEAIPSLDPKRAPVILAGAIIAGAVLDRVGAQSALISEHDTLDGLAIELLAVT